MAGFPGGRKTLGGAGIPPDAPAPFITATSNHGTDNFYVAGMAFAEDINPVGSSNPAVRTTVTGTPGTDTYYVMGLVLAEAGNIGPNAGSFKVTSQGSVGSDTFYIFGMVLSEI